MPAFVNARLPIWFDLGDRSTDFGVRSKWASAKLLNYTENVRALLYNSSARTFESDEPHEGPSEPGEPVNVVQPEPGSHSGQLRGETFHIFRARRA